MYEVSDEVLKELERVQSILRAGRYELSVLTDLPVRVVSGAFYETKFLLSLRIVESLLVKIKQDRNLERTRRASAALPFEFEEVAS